MSGNCTKKEDLSEKNIMEFQFHADMFFQLWVKIGKGLRATTNYVHILGAGHLSEYLDHWRNLYRHSQQGWEALNSMIRTFIYRRTARGGGKHNRSILEPLARWLQRRLMWISGHTYEEMRQYVKHNKKQKCELNKWKENGDNAEPSTTVEDENTTADWHTDEAFNSWGLEI